MNKVKNLADLRKIKSEVQDKLKLRETSNSPDSVVQIKVGMGTSGIASGAKEVMNHLIEELDKRKIDAVVTQVGDMGYSHAEPTIEVKKPGEDPIVFGYVTPKKAEEVIDKYIVNGELLEGILPANYRTIG